MFSSSSGKLPLPQMACPPLFSTKWNRNFETYGSSVVNALSKDWSTSWTCLIVEGSCLVFLLVTEHTQAVEDCLRLSSSKQMAKICSTLGLNTLFISTGTLSGICVLRKASDIRVKLLASWVFVNTLLPQVNLGIYFYISVFLESYGRGEASELKPHK